MMIKVLFVCLGNICRSPMAEAVFRNMVEQEGLTDKFEIDSAATSVYELGNPTHQGTRDRLAKENISVEGMFSRQIEDNDFENYDYVIGMDNQNMMDLKDRVQSHNESKVFQFLDFADRHGEEIADPWFTGNFDVTYDDIKEASKGLLEYLKKEHQL